MFARRRTTVKNLLPGFLPPTSVTARRGNVWVPADVDEALDRLYDRLVAEFVETWYTEVRMRMMMIMTMTIMTLPMTGLSSR